MIFVIIIILILAGLLAFLFTRVLKIEKEVAIIPNEDTLPEIPAPELEPSDEGEGEPKPPEMVDLIDYFNDSIENAPKESSIADERVNAYYQADPLTDLSRGRGYILECRKTLEDAKTEGHIFCAAYIDYDRFSFINNLKGAASGDYVLTQTSLSLQRIFPDGALITRISCDHFAVIFPLSDIALFEEFSEQLKRMGEKIKNDIAVKTGMRVCVGFSMTDIDTSYDANVLIAMANVARHCAKVVKSDKHEMYDESMCQSGFFGDSLMENYSDCQYGEEFSIYYETQIDLFSDKIVGCDTYVRWHYEENSEVALTQDNGRIPTNNEKTVYQTCRSMSRWRKAGREVPMTLVELPILDLFKSDVDDFLGKCLMEFQVEPASLVVKIDVAAVHLDWSTCKKQIKKLKGLGVKICIFNMDTTYSRMDFLSGLPINYVKLHRSFAEGAESHPEHLERCRRIIESAGAIEAQVMFEGVDNIEQATALRGINARTVQGRYTGRPVLADDMARLLSEHIERRLSDKTVILEEADFSKGNYDLF